MALPATSSASFEFSPPLLDIVDPVVQSGVHRGFEGPANRALAELSPTLNGDLNAPDLDSWSAGKSLRFVITSCGFFWLVGAIVFYALH